MAKKPPVHTVPHGDGWANRREGSDKVSKAFATKRTPKRLVGTRPSGRRPSM